MLKYFVADYIGSSMAEDPLCPLCLCGENKSAIRGLRQLHCESRPSARPALHGNSSPVRLGNPLRDRQAEAGAGTVAGAGTRLIRPPETLEDVRQVARGDADAGVPDGKNHELLILLQRQ